MYRALGHIRSEIDDIFRRELEHLLRVRGEEKELADKKLSVQLRNAAAVEDGSAIECGCCSSDIAIDNAVQCTDGHLFCSDCLQVSYINLLWVSLYVWSLLFHVIVLVLLDFLLYHRNMLNRSSLGMAVLLSSACALRRFVLVCFLSR
mgnify:CR=1 FL=1